MMYEAMQKRRSIRRFLKKKPAEKDLEQLIKAAMAAPSASNKQPWKFHIIMNESMIQRAVQEVENTRQKLIEKIHEDYKFQFEHYSENFLAFAHAPALIVITYRIFPLLSQLLEANTSKNCLNTIKKIERDSALIGTACALQNILLMAECSGLGACCMTGPLIAAEKLKECFSIHEGWEIASLVAVGYADEQPSAPARKPIMSMLNWYL